MVHDKDSAPRSAHLRPVDAGTSSSATGGTRATDEAVAGPRRVFISYASEDQAVANAVCDTLERAGMACWIAPRDLLPGMEWAEGILHGVREATVVVVILSSDSNASPQVAREIERASDRRCRIVPFRIENVLPAGTLEYQLSTPHWLDAWEPPFEEHLARLTDTVRRLLERETAPIAPAAIPSTAAKGPDTFRLLVWNLLLFGVVGFVLLRVDFLDIAVMTQGQSLDLPNQILGSLYPTTMQDNATVVLASDESLAREGETWPPSYAFHALMLKLILMHEPRALMLDVIFTDQRADPTLPRLLSALRLYRDAEIPVYAAAVTVEAGGDLVPEIARLVRPVPVPKITDAVDRTHREYRLLLPRWPAMVPTAAMQIYDDRREGGGSIDALARDFHHPMLLVWGTTPPADRDEWIVCTPPPPDVPSMVGAHLFGGTALSRTDCPYTPTLPADYLLADPSTEAIKERIADRVVFYGAAITGVADVVDPPTHQTLPGVYLHAMALDNLLTFGTSYARRPQPGSPLERFLWALELLILLGYGALVSAANIVAARRRRRETPRERLQRGRLQWRHGEEALALAGGLVASLVLSYVAFNLVHVMPANWVGCFAIATLLVLARGWATARP